MSDGIPAGFAALPSRGGDFFDANGPIYQRGDGDDMTLGFRLELRHCNPFRVAHGGMLVGMVDDLMGRVIWRLGKRAATVSLTCDFLAAARLGQWVEVRCQPTQVTPSLIFMRGEVSAEGTTVLTASGVWKMLEAA